MTTQIKETLFGDIRKLIHDAWEFFAPPLIKAGIALACFWYVCGGGPLDRLTGFAVSRAAALPSAGVQKVLADYNLTALVPLAALFLLAIIAYTADRLIYGVAALLPLRFVKVGDPADRIAASDPVLGRHYSADDPAGVRSLVEAALAKARYEKNDWLLGGVESWEREDGRAFGLFAFAQFLVVWAVACASLSAVIVGAERPTPGRMFLLLVAILVFGVYAVCRVAHAGEQLSYARIEVARTVLAGADGFVPPVAPGEQGRARRGEDGDGGGERRRPRDEPWWFIRTGVMDWTRMLRHYRFYDHPKYPPRPRLQALLDHGAHLIWFVAWALLIRFVGGFSPWAGLALFVVYASVVLIDCVLAAVTAAATGWRSAAAWLRRVLPEEVFGAWPESPGERERSGGEGAGPPGAELAPRFADSAKTYARVTVGVRLAGALVGLLLTALLASFVFRSVRPF